MFLTHLLYLLLQFYRFFWKIDYYYYMEKKFNIDEEFFKERIQEAQDAVDEVLKKKPLVSEPVEVVGEPTIIKDAVKASKKIPFKDASVPDTWQILTSEVERIFSPFLTKVDNKKLTTFIESLGADDGFIVSAGLNKGDPWKIFRFDSAKFINLHSDEDR